MNKAMKLVEVLWIGVAAISTFHIYDEWGTDWNTTMRYSLFLGVAVFMYALRRRSRIKHQQNNN